MKPFVTSIDVAIKAGVSRSAVSRTFTPGASVSREVREKVLAAAHELGYRVNRLAQGLNTNSSSNLVGVVGANLSMPFIAKQLDMLSLGLLKRGLQCLLLNAAEARSDIAPLIELIFEFRARAIVVLSGEPPASIVDECLATGVKLILINRPLDRMDTDLITSDNVAGARMVFERFLTAGVQKAAVVTSGSGTPSQQRRAKEFIRLMAEQGIETVQWSKGPTTYETGQQAARELLLDTQIDGVFCVTDLLAVGFMDAARHEMERRVPDDLSVIGFDDIPQAAWASYNLTTIAQSFEKLTEAVLSAIDSDEAIAQIHTIPVNLIERGTVRRGS